MQPINFSSQILYSEVTSHFSTDGKHIHSLLFFTSLWEYEQYLECCYRVRTWVMLCECNFECLDGDSGKVYFMSIWSDSLNLPVGIYNFLLKNEDVYP